MSERTPGPWRAEYSDIPHSSIAEGWTVDSSEHSVCCLDGPKDVNEANARLIASAPDLLEALDKLFARWEHFQGDSWGNQADAYYSLAKGAQKDWKAACEALAKAKGKDQ